MRRGTRDERKAHEAENKIYKPIIKMNHSELLRQQKIQLKMLCDFDAFCKEHNLKFCICFGTLLGAVRHKGFIPWDYDIDIAMTRAEYRRFMQVQNLLPSHLHIRDMYYSDIEHTGISRFIYNDDVLGEVRVDLYILDYARESRTWNKIAERLCRLLLAGHDKFERTIILNNFSGNPLKRLAVKAVWFLSSSRANTERLVYKIRVSKKPTRHYITLVIYTLMPVECFSNLQLLEFEGHYFYAPTNAEELLTTEYGNYMEIPPEGHKWLKEEGLE